ncbi:hypothetical protein BGZ65_000692, partial [Modicella reniformis]
LGVVSGNDYVTKLSGLGLKSNLRIIKNIKVKSQTQLRKLGLQSGADGILYDYCTAVALEHVDKIPTALSSSASGPDDDTRQQAAKALFGYFQPAADVFLRGQESAESTRASSVALADEEILETMTQFATFLRRGPYKSFQQTSSEEDGQTTSRPTNASQSTPPFDTKRRPFKTSGSNYSGRIAKVKMCGNPNPNASAGVDKGKRKADDQLRM